MLEHLKKRLYINSIENKNILLVGKIIENRKIKPIVLSSKGYILERFYELVAGNIDIEEFYMTGELDIDYKFKSHFIKNTYDALEFLKLQGFSDKNIFVLDNLFKGSIDRKDVFFI